MVETAGCQRSRNAAMNARAQFFRGSESAIASHCRTYARPPSLWDMCAASLSLWESLSLPFSARLFAKSRLSTGIERIPFLPLVLCSLASSGKEIDDDD